MRVEIEIPAEVYYGYMRKMSPEKLAYMIKGELHKQLTDEIAFLDNFYEERFGEGTEKLLRVVKAQHEQDRKMSSLAIKQVKVTEL